MRALALFALALFVFDAVSPTLAALSGGRTRSHFVEICTIEGLKRVAISEDPAAPASPNELAFKCPLCAPSGAHAAMDAPVAHRFDAPGPAFERPRERGTFTPHPHRTIAPPPRGPPLYA
jgi:hypothetical protein